MERSEALEFFLQWKSFTRDALRVLAPHCPVTTDKTRSWDISGMGGPQGMIAHYTGGPDGVASHRWGHENPSNKKSSWHATLMNTMISKVSDIHNRYPLVKKYLKVTGLLSAPIDTFGKPNKGTWHGNWTNRYTFGVEIANQGYLKQVGDSFYRGDLRYKRDVHPVLIEDRWWEPYSRSQLESFINIGIALRAIQGPLFKPEWVLPHSAVWAGKSDTGPAFPINHVRYSIFAEDYSRYHLQWLSQYEDHLPDDTELVLTPSDMDALSPDSDRSDDITMVEDEADYESIVRGHEKEITGILQSLGYYIPFRDQYLNFVTYLNFAISVFIASTADVYWEMGKLEPKSLTYDILLKHLNAKIVSLGLKVV